MKSKSDILSDFGKLLVVECFDSALGNIISLRRNENPPLMFKKYADFIRSLDETEFEILKSYHKLSLGGLIVGMLQVFEEHQQFKLYFEDGKEKIDLTELSENFKAEPIIIDGWIDRFSQFGNYSDFFKPIKE